MVSTKYKITFFTGVLFFAFLVAAKAQVMPFYTVFPFEEEDYFTKTVFPFHPLFMKNNKVKGMTLKHHGATGTSYIYAFSPDGYVLNMTVLRSNKGTRDTAFYTRYYYNEKGLLDKKARIDYRDGIIKVCSYQYDQKNRVDIIRIFSLNAQMPNREQHSDGQGELVPGADKMVLQGTLPNDSLWHKMTTEHAFSSWRYRYYTENKMEAEERTEYFDFLINSGHQDTCYQKETYYYLNGFPVALFLHAGCGAKTIPSELYQFKEGLLLGLSNAPGSLEPKKEMYHYDKNRNLVLLEDIWNGQRVSELIMSYDKKGFLTTIQRKSATAKMEHYFEDRILTITYSFY